MEFISKNKISEEQVNSFHEEMTTKFARRLKEEKYKTLFDSLKDWHFLRALPINKSEFTSDYIHLLYQEPFNEK